MQKFMETPFQAIGMIDVGVNHNIQMAHIHELVFQIWNKTFFACVP